MVAVMGHEDAGLLGGLDDGGALGHLDLGAIDGDGDHFLCHANSSTGARSRRM